MKKYDVVLLTDARYVAPVDSSVYVSNILLEDQLLTHALEAKGLKIFRTNWDNSAFDWSTTKSVVLRTTWDYFHRFAEFSNWLNRIESQTILINPAELLRWNIDKHYLLELHENGIAIPPTIFIEKGESKSLKVVLCNTNWSDIILKPAVGGSARHAYKFNANQISAFEKIFENHIAEETFLLQQFQPSVLEKGEVAYMVMNGKFTHAILKKAKPGDFRVQDDFGGTVHEYSASDEEIQFVENVMSKIKWAAVYARVDVIWDTHNKPCVSELEVVEPELWMRFNKESAKIFAQGIYDFIHLEESKTQDALQK